MVNFQGYTKEFNQYIRESGYLSLVSWGILNWEKNKNLIINNLFIKIRKR